jgi:hypothetical protein
MKLLSMLDPEEYQSIMTDVGKAVDASLARHGFRTGQSAASVISNVMSDQDARDRHTAQMLAVSNLVTEAKKASFALSTDETQKSTGRIKLDLAIAAVEREFKQ